MNTSVCKSTGSFEKGERGSARLKFIIVFTLVAFTAYIGYQYIPIAFQSSQYKDFMQQTVDKGSALGKTSDWVKEQLVKNGAEYGVPANALISIEEHEGALQARVQFKRPISIIGYNYEYEFDKSTKSSSLWSIK